MKNGNMKDIIMVCDCNSLEHQIVFRYDGDENFVYAGIHLSKRSFLDRVKYGFMYIFGYECKYGHWDEFIISPSNVDYLESVISTIKKDNPTVDDIKLIIKNNPNDYDLGKEVRKYLN